ncbi:MAG: DUF4079 domain-containing protein [Deltaproteobacteria bacterium]|nr:DUF4079 domain-containing protein [Deltaproteobacteria bacterium]
MDVFLSAHPIIQSLATLLAVYVFHQGLQRFRALHLNQRTFFRWKQHVVLGEIALGMWLAGLLGGAVTVYVSWRGFFITGTHGEVALVMAPFIIFGLASGLYMHYKKRARKVLPFIHGLSNLVVLILACVQVATGWGVYRMYVLGL